MFEKIFSIIREEGYSDGGVVVQVIILIGLSKNLLIGVYLKLAAKFVCSVEIFLIFYRYVKFSEC